MLGNSLVVPWLGLHAFTARSLDLIPVGELRYCSRAKKKRMLNSSTGETIARAEGSIVFSSIVKKLHGPLHLFLN